VRAQAHEARLAELDRDLREKEGGAAETREGIARLEWEVELRRIRAPVAGKIGEVAPVREGAFLAEGERVGAVIPEAAPRAVAEFSPADAMGRIRAGQRARIRLDGFPWIEFGLIEAVVARVSGEPRGGRVRVELELAPQQGTRIPLEHGLPGVAEVEVETIRPATLVLRAAGALVGGGGAGAGERPR
jgi:membrane fusion protein (multidrug efflux system)